MSPRLTHFQECDFHRDLHIITQRVAKVCQKILFRYTAQHTASSFFKQPLSYIWGGFI